MVNCTIFFKDKSPEILSTVHKSDHLLVDFRKWAQQSPENMFSAWRQRFQKKTADVPIKKPKSKVNILNENYRN